jgi:hypothetical protein
LLHSDNLLSSVPLLLSVLNNRPFSVLSRPGQMDLNNLATPDNSNAFD